MHDDSTIGARLRTLRQWRRMTLAQLAGQAGLSTAFLSMVERGLRTLDRRSHISALAAALRVSESEIVGGPHLSDDPERLGAHTAIPPIRVALQTNTLGEAAAESARPMAELQAVLADVDVASGLCDYVRVGELLPGLLDELHYHAVTGSGETRRQALAALIEACHVASTRAKDLGYADLSYLAATRADEAARALGDPVAIGKGAYLRIQAMPRAGSWDRAHTAALQAADAVRPYATTPEGVCVLGMLTLGAALAAAASLRVDEAADLLDEASELAARVDDDPVGNWGSFSAANVGGWRVALAVEVGEGDRVLDLVAGIDRQRYGRRRSRHACLLADVGRGLAQSRTTRHQAVGWLREAEVMAPARIRNLPAVRDTVAVLLEQSRVAAGGRELRGLASRMGLPR